MSSEAEIAKQIQHYIEDHYIRIDNALFDKLVQVAMSEDILFVELEPYRVMDGTTLHLKSGFEVIYEPYRGKKIADQEIEKLRTKIESLENEKDLLIDICHKQKAEIDRFRGAKK